MRFRGFAIPLFGLFFLLLTVYLIRIGLLSNNDLVDTRWELDYYLVDGVESTEFVSDQWIHFEKNTFYSFDSCNEIFGKYETLVSNGFSFDSLAYTLQACSVINSETGERSSMGDVEFREALIRVFFFEIEDGRLYLYNSADKLNGLVFLPQAVPS